MTREHVIPKFLYDFQKSLSPSNIGWNEVASKMVPGEATVKDVCEICNNQRLGSLDAAAKLVLTEANLLTYNYIRPTISLKYDFDLLFRWLLKVSFNSTRTDGAHRYMFEPHIPYMLYGTNGVHRSEIAVLAYFAAPERLSELQRTEEPYSLVTNGAEYINPFHVRISYGRMLGHDSYDVRLVIIGALVFFLLIFKPDVNRGQASAAIRSFIKKNPGAVELSRSRRLIELRPGQQTWLDLYLPQIKRVQMLRPTETR